MFFVTCDAYHMAQAFKVGSRAPKIRVIHREPLHFVDSAPYQAFRRDDRGFWTLLV